MKLSFLSALQYIIFFGIVLLFTSSKAICEYASANTFKKNKVMKIEKIKQASVARENTTEMLHGEIIVKVLSIPFVINKNGLRVSDRFLWSILKF